MGLFAELPEKIAELIRGKKEGAAPKYTYDANSQKYSTSSAPTDGTPAPAQMKKALFNWAGVWKDDKVAKLGSQSSPCE